MKRTSIAILIFFLSTASLIHAQDQQPFIITLYGGLFFPSNVQYKDTYRSSSDLIYGFGIGLPINKFFIVTGDLSFFKSEVLLGPVADSVSRFEERFIHVGLLSRQPFTERLFLRLSGGINYITVKQVVAGPASSEQSLESGKKLGYFGGIGIEQLIEDGKASLFVDALYDYRHLQDVDFNGDYGGVRLVLGVHLILF